MFDPTGKQPWLFACVGLGVLWWCLFLDDDGDDGNNEDVRLDSTRLDSVMGTRLNAKRTEQCTAVYLPRLLEVSIVRRGGGSDAEIWRGAFLWLFSLTSSCLSFVFVAIVRWGVGWGEGQARAGRGLEYTV